jgi:hypothetical protein
MWLGPGRHQAGPARPHGPSFSKHRFIPISVARTEETAPSTPSKVRSSPKVASGCSRTILATAFAFDLDRAWSPPLAGDRPTDFAASPGDAADPAGADHEGVCGLFGGHAAVGSGEEAVTHILGVRGTHARLLNGLTLAMARSNRNNRASDYKRTSAEHLLQEIRT